MADNNLVIKYRPSNFSEVVGQETIVKSLKQVIQKNTSHAFLFIGSSGVGKTTLARICAFELGAINPGDITELDAGQFTGIDDIRTLVSNLKYKPIGNSTTKAVIVNESHRLTVAAQDGLLTSVEEPLSHVYWFFTTTEGNKIRPAIKTRCTTYDLKSVGHNILFDLLINIANAEELNASDPVIDLCCKEAHGSPRQAIANLAVCADITDRIVAADLLKTVELDNREIIELCRMLLKGGQWEQLQPILLGLRTQNPESIRCVVQAYLETVILESRSEQERLTGLNILEYFSTPFLGNGIGQVLLAIGRLLYGQ